MKKHGTPSEPEDLFSKARGKGIEITVEGSLIVNDMRSTGIARVAEPGYILLRAGIAGRAA